MAKVRLQIELDEKAHKLICGDGVTLFNTGMRCGKTLLSQILVAIRNGTPMQNCNNCIGRNNDFFKKWVNYKMLDEIKTEIEHIEISGRIDEHNSFIRTGEHIKTMVIEIIDKYKTDMLK